MSAWKRFIECALARKKHDGLWYEHGSSDIPSMGSAFKNVATHCPVPRLARRRSQQVGPQGNAGAGTLLWKSGHLSRRISPVKRIESAAGCGHPRICGCQMAVKLGASSQRRNDAV